jgi:MoaA/NifB/PqqE/SkfB family radical SAM enzyme
MNDPTAPFTKPNPNAGWLRRVMRDTRRGALRVGLRNATGSRIREWNSRLNWREFWHGKTEIQSFPRQIQVGTNWTCNLKCSFCRLTMEWTQAELKKLPPRELSISDKVEKVVRRLLPYCEMMVLTPLGEPLQWRGLNDLLQYHAEIGSRNLALTTNGILLNDRNAERLVRSQLSRMFISIDSNDPGVYGEMRVGGELKDVEAGIRRINDWKRKLNTPFPYLVVNSTFMQRNIPQLPSMVGWAKDLGIGEISVQLMEIENPDHELEFLGHHPLLTKKYVIEALDIGRRIGMQVRPHLAIRNLISAEAEGHDVTDHEFMASSPIMPDDKKDIHIKTFAEGDMSTEQDGCGTCSVGADLDNRLDMRGKSLVEKCHYPWYNMLIDTDGDARPCCWADVSFGNLNQMSFDDIWNGEVAQKMRRDFLSDHIPESCRKKHCRVDL